MKNIFIEGLQGTGKSTLQRLLAEQLPDYHIYHEGDYSPVELAWCTYMTESEYNEALTHFPDFAEEIKKRTTREDTHFIVEYTRILTEQREFYQHMEQYEIYNGRRTLEEFKQIIQRRFTKFSGTGNLFECAFFQNIIEDALLYFEMSEQEILNFYQELFAIVKEKDFCLIYLFSEEIEKNILEIKKERSDYKGVELWYQLMMNYLNDSPYGKKHPFHGVEDMAAHFRRRMKVEQKIIKEVIGKQAIVIPAKDYQLGEVIRITGRK